MAEPGAAAAKGGFERVSNVWEFDDFWTRRNTFDAYLRFVDAAELKWPNDPMVQQMSALREKIIRTNHEYFLSKYNSNVWWTDDYGWWAMACLTARLGE